MLKTDKSTFLRALTLFNPTIARTPSPAAYSRIAESIENYDATGGGTWNYDSLFVCVRSVLKGLPVEQARLSLKACIGPGEAEAKIGLFDAMNKSLGFANAEYIDAESTLLKVSDSRSLVLAPDFSLRNEEGIREVFVYPKAEPPLKRVQFDMIVAALARPKIMARDQYKLSIVEYPKIKGVRKYRIQNFDYEYRELRQDFLDHLFMFYRELDRDGDQGGLFDT